MTSTRLNDCLCEVCLALRQYTLVELQENSEEIIPLLPDSVREVLVSQGRVRLGVSSDRDVQIVKAAAERCTSNRIH